MNNPSGVKAWLSGERITALLFLGLVAIYGWEGSKFTAALQVDVVGPSLFPRILTVAGLLLGLILLIKAPRRDAEDDAMGVREHLVVLMPTRGMQCCRSENKVVSTQPKPCRRSD